MPSPGNVQIRTVKIKTSCVRESCVVSTPQSREIVAIPRTPKEVQIRHLKLRGGKGGGEDDAKEDAEEWDEEEEELVGMVQVQDPPEVIVGDAERWLYDAFGDRIEGS
jgi:hypothetical protein